MTVGPELVLAAEVGIPAAAVVIGHKRSKPIGDKSGGVAEMVASASASGSVIDGEGKTCARQAMAASLTDGRSRLQRVVVEWLRRAPLDCVPTSYVYRL